MIQVKEQWNTHRIRKSRNDSVAGRPDSLFFLPDLHGAKDCLVDVRAAKIEFGTQHITEELDGTDNEHQEYFDYARISLLMPLHMFSGTWRWPHVFASSFDCLIQLAGYFPQ